MKWHLEKVKITQLKEFDKNPRQLTEKGLSDLRKSIERFGIAEPLVVDTDFTICGGHGRLKILQELNIKEVDCYLPDKKLTAKQFKELNIRLNKNQAGQFDFDILANEYEFEDLLEWGFEEKELGTGVTNTQIRDIGLKPFQQTHILISFSPDRMINIQKYLEKIKKIDGIEIEQSSN